MAQTIKIKRSALSGKIPETTDIDLGELAINTTDGKLFLKKTAGAQEDIVEVGGSVGFEIKNQTGVTIPKGTVVKFVGTLGASGRILAAPFLANGTDPSELVLGITNTAIPNGGDGFAVDHGKIFQINTSSFSSGTILYASATVPGGLTATRPAAPNNKVTIAAVVNSHANNGVLDVRLSLGSSLENDELVELGTLADGDTLVWNSVTGRFENEQPTGGGASVTTSTTPPASPENGDLWLDSTDASLKVYYVDIDGGQWVAVGGPAGPKGSDGPTIYPGSGLAVSTGTAWGTSVLPGTAGNVLTSNGTSWVSQAGAAAASVQTFASSGTWTKPAGAQFVLVEVWGAGGGGGRPTAGAANGPGSGGGGGSYKQEIFLASSLPSSVSVIIAAGGTGGTSNGASGTSGGNTNFGGLIAAWGGSGGNGFATGTNVNSGGTGGGTQSAGTNNSRIAGAPQNYNGAVGNYDIGPSNFGGGIGGGTYTLGTTTTTIYNGRSSGFGGGGGGAANGSASTGDIGNGGASSYGGGGGGAGGASTTSGSSFARSAAEGGGPIPFTIDAVGSGVGGGARTTPGAKAPTPAAFLGGAGGSAAFSQASFSNAIGDVNGSQVVLLSQSSLGASENLLVINVSSNGLSNYTPYAVVNRAVNISRAGIAFDGSKYVICCLQFITAVPNSFYRYIISTTDFVNFTEHPVPSNLDGAVTGDTNTQAGSNYLKYINSTFFMCTSTDVFYSTNLVTWTRANIAGGSNAQVRDFAYDGTFYYALVGGGVRRSSDLSTWTQYAHGAGASSESLAASPTHVVVTSSFGTARFSTDQGVTWSNLPSVPANVGRTVRYFAATASWLMSWNDIGAGTRGGYFSTAPGTSWTLVTTSSAVTHNQPIYNGSRYIFAASSVAMVSTAIGGTYTAQTSTTLSLAAAAGGDGGVAGGGGGGAASSTTTTNGGAGGNGLCRVYTW